ncbi:ubiquitin-like domain-containing protein [Salipaludibacillus sp. CUR1]|uniref:G5 and 3D domain-containing protein n=1 Tax=Salipaludibacillus sp. CUR1 TaxID=2820003 RepID=UPI001E283161|nr:G5 and 3D domain-containing protein [Salipaludibacillus sp. CUR1]MCE7791817.1 ubiquitin-like domain-containing protein [Salipaludibacillus sp. CUR1]
MSHWMKQLHARFSWRKLAVSSVGLLALTGILVLAVYELTKAEVTVKADEELLAVYTHASTVGEVLEEQDIDTTNHDYIEPSEETVISEAMTIVYKPAQRVDVNLEGEERSVWTTAATVGELMDDLYITVDEHDYIQPELDKQVNEGMQVIFKPAFQVTVISDGEKETVWSTSTTVADFLEKEDIALGEMDRVEPDKEEELREAAEIKVIRVEKVTDVVEETVDYATVTRNDSSLQQGNEEVKQQGKKGKIEKRYEVVLEDGEEVSRKLINEEVIKESEDRIVAVGTKKQTETVSRGSSSAGSSSSESSSGASSSGSSNSSNSSGSSDRSGSSGNSSSSSGGNWETYTATAYTASCTGCSGVTATGIDLKANPDANVIAVDPAVIPLGSRVEVKGYGTYIAGDTGGAIKGKKIDIFIPDSNKVKSFGRRNVQVRVLD